MSANGLPFQPCPGSAQNLSVTVSNTQSAAIAGMGNSLRLANLGTATVFYRLGDGTAPTASATTDAALPSGAIEIIGCGAAPFIAAITSSSTATLNVCRGEGV